MVSPDTDPLKPIISEGDKVFGNAKNLPPQMGAALLGQAITGIVDRYKNNPPPAQFRFIVSPLVDLDLARRDRDPVRRRHRPLAAARRRHEPRPRRATWRASAGSRPRTSS